MFLYGRKVDIDKIKGLNLIKQAAEKGFIEAQFLLGITYFYGDGVEHDNTLGLKWIVTAARNNHSEALELLKHLKE
jgi:TPR repeat protein